MLDGQGGAVMAQGDHDPGLTGLCHRHSHRVAARGKPDVSRFRQRSGVVKELRQGHAFPALIWGHPAADTTEVVNYLALRQPGKALRVQFTRPGNQSADRQTLPCGVGTLCAADRQNVQNFPVFVAHGSPIQTPKRSLIYQFIKTSHNLLIPESYRAPVKLSTAPGAGRWAPGAPFQAPGGVWRQNTEITPK